MANRVNDSRLKFNAKVRKGGGISRVFFPYFFFLSFFPTFFSFFSFLSKPKIENAETNGEFRGEGGGRLALVRRRADTMDLAGWYPCLV